MVDNIKIEDLNRFNELGTLINPHFTKLFNLENILNSTYDYIIGYYDNNDLIAFLHITKSYETIDIVNIVTDSKYRNKGIASVLIDHLLTMFNDTKTIMLEVNEHNNPAINLYKKHNFVEIYRRKKYYGNDDALIMKRDV